MCEEMVVLRDVPGLYTLHSKMNAIFAIYRFLKISMSFSVFDGCLVHLPVHMLMCGVPPSQLSHCILYKCELVHCDKNICIQLKSDPFIHQLSAEKV